MNILVINCGSSSIKYRLYDMAGQVERASGLIERIGEADSHTTHNCDGRKIERSGRIDNYERGV
ncbi:MAG: acetate kinase, partial [Phycisphaerae bacterium]